MKEPPRISNNTNLRSMNHTQNMKKIKISFNKRGSPGYSPFTSDMRITTDLPRTIDHFSGITTAMTNSKQMNPELLISPKLSQMSIPVNDLVILNEN